MKCFHFALLSLSLLSASPSKVEAWGKPWSRSQNGTAPWITSDRAERRESFFRGLGDKAEAAREEIDETLKKGAATINRNEIKADRRSEFEAEMSGQPESRSRFSMGGGLQAAPNPSAAKKEEAELKGPDEISWQQANSEFSNSRIKTEKDFSTSVIWPVEGGRISSGYGYRGGKLHEGVDIRSAMGQSIRAVASGKVVYAGKIRGYGRVVVVYHGAGISTLYAHNSFHIVKTGDLVAQGDRLALVGTSGESSGPHCHFEVRKNGKAINPLSFKFANSPMSAEANSRSSANN